MRAANASDEPGLDLNALAITAPEVLASLPVSLHVAASLVSSTFPIFDIWRAHLYADSEEQLTKINLTKGTQNVLISRPGALEIGVTLLGPGDAAFLAAVAGHLPFGVACGAAIAAEEDYDLGSGLGNLVLARALATTGQGQKVINRVNAEAERL